MSHDEEFRAYASGATSIATAVDLALFDNGTKGAAEPHYPDPRIFRDPGKLSYEKYDVAEALRDIAEFRARHER